MVVFSTKGSHPKKTLQNFGSSFQKSMFLIFLNIDLHASKHIYFSITYQPKPYQKISIFWLIRILSEIDFTLSNFRCQNVQTTRGGAGGSEPILSIKAFSVRTSLAGGVKELWTIFSSEEHVKKIILLLA